MSEFEAKEGLTTGTTVPPTSSRAAVVNVVDSKFGALAADNSLLTKDADFIAKLDSSSIEDVVELKISRFLDQVGSFYPENVHELIMSKVEKPLIIQVLRRVGGNRIHASRILGINRNTLRKKMKLYGI